MKWNEAVAIAVAILLGIMFIFVPLFSLIFEASGITNNEPMFSAYDGGYADIDDFIGDVERYNCHVENSIFSADGDSKNDYKVRSIVSTPTLLLGDLINPEDTIYVAVGIENSYTQEEIRAINSFLARGGHAIIADDFGNANQLANEYGVTYFGGQFYDENFDYNNNYTIVTAHMGSDIYDREGGKEWSKASPFGDGVWDDDQDADGKIDEDDNTGSSKNLDDDRDNSDLSNNLRDDDLDGIPDEEGEGIDEDPIDDDVSFTPGGDAKNLWRPIENIKGHRNVDIEWLNGLDDDNDDIIDEDLQTYELITYKPTGLSSSINSWIWASGSSKSWIDMDNNGILSIPQSGDLKGKNADEVSSVGNEIQVCIEIPVADDGTGAVDVISGESKETIKSSDGNPKKYRVGDINLESSKKITQLGSIVFISDPSIFMNDLYSLNHIRFDVNLPWDPEGNGLDDDGDGVIDEDREILRETGDVTEDDIDDENDIADKSPDFWSETEVEKFSKWLDADMVGKPKIDYDNKYFLMDLVHHLCPAAEDEQNLILVDESRHSNDDHFFKPFYKTMEVTGFLTSSPYYAYPIVFSIGFLMIFAALLVKDKESWAHRFDISLLEPRKVVPNDNRLQTTKIRLALREKLRLIRGLSPEEFSSLNESTIYSSVKDPDLIELLQNQDRTYSPQELQRIMEKIKKIQNI